MGGCLSVADPATRDPVDDQPPMAKSLCQCVCDFFMKCLFSRWCAGGFGKSMIKTTGNIPPARSQDERETRDLTLIHGRRAFSFNHTENSLKHVTTAITEGQDRPSNLIHRHDFIPGRQAFSFHADSQDLELQELFREKKGIDSNNRRRDNFLVEKLANAEAAATVTIEDKKGASASNPNEATGVEGSEVVEKNEDASSAN